MTNEEIDAFLMIDPEQERKADLSGGFEWADEDEEEDDSDYVPAPRHILSASEWDAILKP